jgi:short-subunit dehydrogenase
MTRMVRTAIVTGGASGMGRLVVERLAARGTAVAAVDVDAEALATLAERNEQVVTVACDVTDDVGVTNAAKELIGRFGSVDRLVCAAGIGAGGPILSTDLARTERLVQVNYVGLVRWVHAVAPSMVEERSGQIVLFASLAGWVPSPGMGPYCASKAAVVSFAESLSEELRPSGVQVLAVCPPAVETPMLRSFLVEGGLGSRGLAVVPPISPDAVVDAIDPALERGRRFLFPSRSARALFVARRLTPGLARAALRRFYDPPADTA